MEQWKQIQGYEGYYEISNLGNIRSIERTVDHNGRKVKRKGKMIKPNLNRNGYLTARLCKNGKSTAYLIHRLVAIHFIDNPNNKPVVNHKDFNRQNNNSENLEWTTQKENIEHAESRKDEATRIVNVKKALTKISPEDKQWIKDNYITRDKTFGAKALAEKFGVTPVYISIIANSK